MSQQRKLKITLTLEVDLDFLAHYPCTRDWSGLFGQLDRTRFHYLVGEQDPTLGKILTEITKFFVDKAVRPAPVDEKLVAEGEQLKNKLSRYLKMNYDF